MRTNVSRRSRHRESGQILVLFVGGLVTVLLITALVIDLGFTFMTRRHEQNAVDPAAIAAARYIRATGGPDIPSMWSVACFYALQNGFQPTQRGGPSNNQPCDSGNPVDGSNITVSYPPTADAGDFSGRDGFVEVTLSRRNQSFFAGVAGLTQIGRASCRERVLLGV